MLLSPRIAHSQWARLVGLAALCLAGGPAAAHPHVFIDTRISAILDDAGQLTGIRLRWEYDDYTSMLLVEDKGADVDGDGGLSSTEMAALNGFDMTWAEGFDGDTTLAQNDQPLILQPGPRDWATGWAGGRLWSEHTRRLASPVDPGAGPVVIQVYDVTDYTAYALAGTALVGGAGCRIAPPSQNGAGDGILSTLGLFLFGGDTFGGDTAASPDPMTPRAAVAEAVAGRAVAVLTCGG